MERFNAHGGVLEQHWKQLEYGVEKVGCRDVVVGRCARMWWVALFTVGSPLSVLCNADLGSDGGAGRLPLLMPNYDRNLHGGDCELQTYGVFRARIMIERVRRDSQ